MFNLSTFIMNTLEEMAEVYPSFQVKEYALNWYARGKLTEEDLQTVATWFEAVK